MRGTLHLLPPDDAAPVVIDAYLGTYGPASPATFDAWLLRGATPRATLRRWFTRLMDDGRLDPGFDQAVLGPGTAEGHVVPAAHRRSVSLKAGWIAPVVIRDGVTMAIGTWSAEKGRVETVPFSSFPAAVRKQIATEAARIGPLLA